MPPRKKSKANKTNTAIPKATSRATNTRAARKAKAEISGNFLLNN